MLQVFWAIVGLGGAFGHCRTMLHWCKIKEKLLWSVQNGIFLCADRSLILIGSLILISLTEWVASYINK